jgi:lysophospholipase L1-like esterase
MKTAILIGDSIRMGYQIHVETALDGVARVWGPDANGGDSGNVRAHLSQWLETGLGDIVHLNCGLHDIKKAFDSDQAQVDESAYRENLIYIFETVLATGIPLVWATTTPVNETWHHDRTGVDRFSADVDAYNAIAQDEAQKRGVAVDDLHDVIETAGRDELLQEDGVHFSAEGCALLGRHVATCVQKLWTEV